MKRIITVLPVLVLIVSCVTMGKPRSDYSLETIDTQITFLILVGQKNPELALTSDQAQKIIGAIQPWKDAEFLLGADIQKSVHENVQSILTTPQKTNRSQAPFDAAGNQGMRQFGPGGGSPGRGGGPMGGPGGGGPGQGAGSMGGPGRETGSMGGSQQGPGPAVGQASTGKSGNVSPKTGDDVGPSRAAFEHLTQILNYVLSGTSEKR